VTGGGWHAETSDALLPQVLHCRRAQGTLGVFLLRCGSKRAQRADQELLDVIADALVAANDVRAMT
jgi:hypothetical protein